MHISFDLYPSYLRSFDDLLPEKVDYRLTYDIYAMRNYEYREKNGQRLGPFPQVRKEGSLKLFCRGTKSSRTGGDLRVQHTRSWSTWTNQAHASKQTIDAKIGYSDNMSSLGQWTLSYHSEPILPVKSYRFHALQKMHQSGFARGRKIEIQTLGSPIIRHYETKNVVCTLYTLIEGLHRNIVSVGPVDYLDDLSIFRPNLEIVALPDQRVEIDRSFEQLHGFALVGPGLLPLYFWQNTQNCVLAVIGRNVAYTLSDISI